MYKIISEFVIMRVADEAYIPTDPENRDYKNYLAWLAAGGVPIPADPPYVLPDPIPKQ